MGIADNIRRVRERIGAAAERSGRSPDDVLLVAVTKTRLPEEIEQAALAGCFDIGENKVQEIIDKYDIVGDFQVKTEKIPNIKWHMIGHLQRNKVKYIVEKADLIHSVDSIRLAEEIDRRAGEKGVIKDVLVQVSPAGEESKFGIRPEETRGLLVSLQGFANLQVRGLMCMAPAVEDPEDVRGDFRVMKELFDDAAGRYESDFDILSMGMTNDFEVAVEEGSTLVRVGTAIFGPRRQMVTV